MDFSSRRSVARCLSFLDVDPAQIIDLRFMPSDVRHVVVVKGEACLLFSLGSSSARDDDSAFNEPLGDLRVRAYASSDVPRIIGSVMGNACSPVANRLGMALSGASACCAGDVTRGAQQIFERLIRPALAICSIFAIFSASHSRNSHEDRDPLQLFVFGQQPPLWPPAEACRLSAPGS